MWTLTWKEYQGNQSAIECVLKNTHTSPLGDRVAFVYMCCCVRVHVWVSAFPESQLASLNACGVLWDNPRISFTYDKDTSYDVLRLFCALVSQGIVQFVGKNGYKGGMASFYKLLCQIVAQTIFKQWEKLHFLARTEITQILNVFW